MIHVHAVQGKSIKSAVGDKKFIVTKRSCLYDRINI